MSARCPTGQKRKSNFFQGDFRRSFQKGDKGVFKGFFRAFFRIQVWNYTNYTCGNSFAEFPAGVIGAGSVITQGKYLVRGFDG